MKVTIRRSDEYVKNLRISTGRNDPESIDVEVDPAELSEDARRQVVLAKGQYADIDGLRHDHQFETNQYCQGGNELFAADVELDQVTPELLSSLITDAAQRLAAKRAEYQRKEAQRQEQEAAKRAAVVADLQPVIDEVLAEDSGWYDSPITGGLLHVKGQYVPKWHPQAEALARVFKHRHAAAEHRSKEIDRICAEKMRGQLDEWVRTYGTDGQRRRQARGLLADQEVIDAIREQTFAGLSEMQRYPRIKDNEVIASYVETGVVDDYYQDGDGTSVSYNSAPAESGTDEQMDMIERIEQSLPRGAHVELMMHRGWLDDTSVEQDDIACVERCSVKATVVVGELTLSREYAA